jgi:hypothetical protein
MSTATQTEATPTAAESLARFDLERHHRELASRGFTVLPQVLPREQAERIGARLLELMALDPAFAKTPYYNLDGVFEPVTTQEDVDLFVPLLGDPAVLAVAERAVGKEFQMSNVGGVQLKPHGMGAQCWHNDVPFGWFCHNHRPFPDFTMAITALWMLSDYSAANGGTRLVPYSHKTRSTPIDVIHDPDGYHRMEHEYAASGPAGSCLIFDNAIWHCAGRNTTSRDRLHITIPYFPQFLDGGNLNWRPVPRRIFDMFPPHVRRLHKHVAEDRT